MDINYFIPIVKKAMEDQGVSMNQLGRETGIDPGTISRFLSGTIDITSSKLYAILKALKFKSVKL